MMIPKKIPALKHQVEAFSDVIPLIDKYFLQMEPVKISARDFCRNVHRLTDLPEIEVIKTEMAPPYRRSSVELLCKVLDVSRQSILNWRRGLDFPYMPEQHQRFLGLYWERYQLFTEIKKIKQLRS